MIRIEDGYGRVVDEQKLDQYKDDNADQEKDGIFTVDLPRNLPLNITLLEPDGEEGWKPCIGGFAFVTAKQEGPQTLLLGDCGMS